jgi:hypothetical protein
VPGVRIFIYNYDSTTNPATADLAVFFFVRLRTQPAIVDGGGMVIQQAVTAAYCATLGVNTTVDPSNPPPTASTVYTQLQCICWYMQNVPPATPTPPAANLPLEFVNSERDLSNIAGDSDAAKLLVAVYHLDQTTNAFLAVPPIEYQSGFGDPAHMDPWFPPIKRWLINPVTPKPYP